MLAVACAQLQKLLFTLKQQWSLYMTQATPAGVQLRVQALLSENGETENYLSLYVH